MDERFLEVACEQEEAERRFAADQATKGGVIPTKDLEPHEYKTTWCDDCGDDLEEFRMKKGRTLCVICQGKKEKREQGR
ncbi:hypothetical protein Lumi_036 [Xylophilus phage Lumi]|nr:hypothetical protein Lumi_036 [Xylophilus phage Lumi]